MKLLITLLLSTLLIPVYSQNSQTAENSLYGDSTNLSHTTIGGYGNAFYKRDFNQKYASINLERFVLFVGHKFNTKISFFSELEVEDAKIAGGEDGGEIALEQCYIKFNINPNNYFVAGLFLPRIGILNENHLPNAFNGNERTQVETFIIPSTWRELGFGVYGNLNGFPLSWSFALVNGLNSSAFEHGSLIREGRFEGRNASANNLAITGALQFTKNDFKVQISGYYGGSVGLAAKEADSLNLKSGIFGTPILAGEADMQYEANGFSARILGSVITIPDAADINNAYDNNTPKRAYGLYGEIAYNIFEKINNLSKQQMILFARYEKLNMNASIPLNGIFDGTLNQQHIVFGVNYLPINNIVVKADVRLLHTGKPNPILIPTSTDYKVNNTFLNFGIGFSF